MKKILTLLLLLAASTATLLAQSAKTDSPSAPKPRPSASTRTNSVPPSGEIVKIDASEAKDHIGDRAIVTGKVAEVNQNDKVLRLNLDEPFPNQALTAIIFGSNTNVFKKMDLFSLKGKTVAIRGNIAEFKGHPEIILVETNQVKLVDKQPAP